MLASKWSLQIKVAAGTIMCFLVLAIAVALIAHLLIFPSFVEVERTSGQRDLERCVAKIEAEIEYVTDSCSEWASWTETYTYAQDQNLDYEKNNLTYVLQDYEMHLALVLNADNEVIWKKAKHPELRKSIELEAFKNPILSDNHQMLKMQAKPRLMDMSLSGVIPTEFGPMMIASRPILKSNGDGPRQGTFILGQFLSSKVINQMQSQISVPFEFRACSEEERAMIGSATGPSRATSVEYAENQLTLMTLFDDLAGNSSFVVKTEFPREITARLARAMSLGIGFTILSVFFVLLFMLLLLRTLILNPVAEITHFISDIEQRGLNGSRLAFSRSDEIGILANKTNDAIAALEQLRILKGLLPICSCCKRIRDQEGGWEQLECYIDEHSEAEFTHGICPDCAPKYYPNLFPESV